ncbi:MAG TPA: hypothetical protein VHL59_07965, partial [Thermoanaerobaculia bacterium]|nr:hypothetical protein [Thermoanaerobaculia bacterium]
YTLAGSTIGLLVATLGRLYSSAFYALHDTKTPFRIAVARVIGGAALALLFAFPLRPMFFAILEALNLPVPNVAAGAAALGVVAISTASALAAWIEFLLLRRGIDRRLGRGEPMLGYLARLFAAALAAGAAAVAADVYFLRDFAARLPLRHVSEAFLAAVVFGLVYFAAGFALRVPEVRATLGRFMRR